jgi:glyoxylate carboligase
MVGATPLMRRQGFSVHAKVGRQFSTAPGIVRGYGRSLPRNVVIELGTNGTVSLAACRAVVRAAGPSRRVFLVTNRVPRTWQDSNNATLQACDASFTSSRVRLIDWHAASAGHPEWFAADGVHPSAEGRRAFAALIARAVDKHGL